MVEPQLCKAYAKVSGQLMIVERNSSIVVQAIFSLYSVLSMIGTCNIYPRTKCLMAALCRIVSRCRRTFRTRMDYGIIYKE